MTFFPYRFFAVIFLGLALLSGPVAHAADRLATGDYAPLVGSKLPENGVTAAIVRAAMQANRMEAEFDFLPWKRGYIETEAGRYIATFPYLRTAEREASFIYSDEIYRDHFDIFVLADMAKQANWKERTLCIPRGYDQTQIAQFIALNSLRIETPADIESCFMMLKAQRVSGVWVSELVAAQAIRQVFAAEGVVVSAKLHLVGDVGYYLIASRGSAKSAPWIAQFNAGLKKIRSNGSYQRIVSRSLQH